jgi:hypothetical protein
MNADLHAKKIERLQDAQIIPKQHEELVFGCVGFTSGF